MERQSVAVTKLGNAVVTDVEMPGSMNGFELARAVREQWPGVRVIVTSERRHPGADDLPEEIPFLAKPYPPATVINLIRQMATPQVVVSLTPADGKA